MRAGRRALFFSLCFFCLFFIIANRMLSLQIITLPGQGYVEVNFLSQIVFVFLLFLGMLMKLKQKKNINYLR